MGQSTSRNQTTISNNYLITGSNNGLTTGGQSIGSANAGASTDVSPKADLNYSTSINPSMFGTLTGIKTFGGKILGTIGVNSDMIQTIKHVVSSVYRVAKDEPELIEKARSLANKVLNNVTSDGVIKSSDQLTFETIKDIADMQVAVVDRMNVAHDDYQTMALGTTGIRNNEVNTKLTESSLTGLYNRATPLERSNRDRIVKTAGTRLGLISKDEDTPPVDYAMNTFDNAMTKYGKLSELKRQSEKITGEHDSILFSVLHNPANTLARSGVLAPFNIESNYFIGTIKQVSIPFTAISYPNGHQFSGTNLISLSAEVIDVENNQPIEQGVAISSYAYTTPFDDDTREIRLGLSGQITISKQPYDPQAAVSMGFIYKREGKYYYTKAVTINTSESIDFSKHSVNSVGSKVETYTTRNYESSRGKTNIIKDYQKLAISDPLRIYTPRNLTVADNDSNISKIVTERKNMETENTERPTFSYSSQWQCVINISNTEQLEPNIVFKEAFNNWNEAERVSAVFVATYPKGLSMAVSVQTPTIQIVTVKIPQEMRYIGNRYYGKVLDLLGEVPDWYATSDMHDPWYIFRKVIAPIINYAGRIAIHHAATGAPYALTVEHVKRARYESGLETLSTELMRAHIIELITGIARWMSDTGPVSKYTKNARKMLFMHLCEKVMYQSMTHIDIFAERIEILRNAYLSDCNDFNSNELAIDEALVGRI